MVKPVFKHLSEEENIVAEEFIKRVVPDGEVKFDVPLKSRKALVVETAPEHLKKLWEYLTAKKIDMIVEYPSKIMIVEIKRILSAAAVGQLLLYKKMYTEQYKPLKPIELWHIAMYPDWDVIDLLSELDIKWWVLNESLV